MLVRQGKPVLIESYNLSSTAGRQRMKTVSKSKNKAKTEKKHWGELDNIISSLHPLF